MADKSTDNALDPPTRDFLATNLKGLMQDVMEWMEIRNSALRGETPFAHATPAEAKLFASLRGRERSISELARAMGVSRQAVHRTVHRLVSVDVVELVPAEGSHRDKLVRITPAGRDVQRMAAANLRQIEAEITELIGREAVESIRQHLIDIAQATRKTGLTGDSRTG